MQALPENYEGTGVLWPLLGVLPDYDPFRDSAGYVFREALALEVLDFWENHITHIEGEPEIAGQPYRLAPHEACLLSLIFGFVDAETGYRRYKVVFYYVPRKNSKTTWGTGLLICLAVKDRAIRMQLYSLGAAGDQAEIVYDIMAAMIAGNDALSQRFRVTKSPKMITYLADGTRYKPRSTDSKGQHGKNTHAVLYDEIHEYRNDEAIGALHTSMATRRQGLEIFTTTADHIGESVCNQKYDYACGVRDGLIDDPQLLPAIYEVPPAVVERDPDYWRKEEWWAYANPLFGQSVQRDYLAKEVRDAILNPHLRPRLQRLHLNVRVSNLGRMISAEAWARNAGAYRREDFLGQTARGASIDLGMTSDLCSLSLLFGDAVAGFKAIWWHWIPERAAVEYEESKGLPFRRWQEEGLITITPGDEIDYERILLDLAGPEPGETDPAKASVRGIGQDYVICTPPQGDDPGKALAVDRLFQGVWLCQQLVKRGWNIREFGQGYYSMAAPTAEFLRLVNAGKWAHGDNGLMAWQANNAMVERNTNDDMKPSKRNSEGKIDGIITGIMSTGMALEEQAQEVHAYVNRGIRFVRPTRDAAALESEPAAVAAPAVADAPPVPRRRVFPRKLPRKLRCCPPPAPAVPHRVRVGVLTIWKGLS